MQEPPAEPSQAGKSGTPTRRSGVPSRAVDEKVAGALLDTAIKRLTEVVDEETRALRDRKPIDLNLFNSRKSQGLLELDRALRLLEGADPGEAMKTALRLLRLNLETNRQVLNTHLEAVREVAAIIADAIRNVESDGTYSFSFRSKGPAP
jgi:hypothetical protein